MADRTENGGVNLRAMARVFSNRKEAGRGTTPRAGSKAAKLRAGKSAKTRRGKTRRV